MLVKSYCFAVFQFPTTATPASAIKTIPAANFPAFRDLGIREYYSAFRESVRVFGVPITPRGKDYLEVAGDRTTAVDIGVYDLVLFGKGKHGTTGDACNGINATGKIRRVGKVPGNMQTEKAVHKHGGAELGKKAIGIGAVKVGVIGIGVFNVGISEHTAGVTIFYARGVFTARNNG